ncbi:MAG: DeoR/GlpR family DNA-binding transcription regulator [Thermanaerothrix sp.]|nr:DeoR/GlpR family DNA-binding transcription regulator [Thermanaerothrix sp.]
MMKTQVQKTAFPGPDRQGLILDLINRRQRVSIAEICEAFGISEATARRDLEALDQRGLICKVRGGAIPARRAPAEPPILQRSNQHLEEKRRIAQAAVKLIQEGETIFLGSGSTVLELARLLRSYNNLTVITNSLPVINELAASGGITLVGLGGVLRSSELSFIGHITEQALSEVRADKVFIGIHAVDVGEGLTNAYLPETLTDRAILKIGREIIVLADHSKCGRVSTARVAPINTIHTLITDTGAPQEFIEALRQAGVRVIQA